MTLYLSNRRILGWCHLAHRQAKQPHNDHQHRCLDDCLASCKADAADKGNIPWAAATAAGTDNVNWLNSGETVSPEVLAQWSEVHRCKAEAMESTDKGCLHCSLSGCMLQA